jgi:hypothetical protein
VLAGRWSTTVADELLPRLASEPDLGPDPSLPGSLVALAELYPARLATTLRKQHGAWFTPTALAEPTVDRALAPLLATAATASHGLRIVDPAVGGGTLLRAALRTLRRAGWPAATAARCLQGIDIDATAATLAALALWEACNEPDLPPHEFLQRCRTGDGLRELDDGTFDAVLTNPPWETLQAGADAKARAAALRPHFHQQGRGKLYTYRLFLERACSLLRPGGRLGAIVPASLWFDRDAEPLRRLLLDRCTWEWLFGFENRAKVFAIDGRYRFGVVIATKGGSTERVQVAFGRTELADWATPTPAGMAYGRDELRAFSPHSGTFVEVGDAADLDILRTMHRAGTPLLGSRGAFAWRQGDFNLTSDRAHFVTRAAAEAAGHVRGDDAVWRRAGHPDLLPLYQGAMIGDLHPNLGAHAGGTGHGTRWETPRVAHELRPAYLVDAASYRQRTTAATRTPFRLVHRALSNATNSRTAIVCLLPDHPCGNSLGVLQPQPCLATGQTPFRDLAAVAAVLSSLAFDYALRLRLGGTNLNGFVLADCVLPPLPEAIAVPLAQAALRLCAILPWHDSLWQRAAVEGFAPAAGPAHDGPSRDALLTTIDALVGTAYGLTPKQVDWITRDCDLPCQALGRPDVGQLPSKGFWRLDRDRPAAERRPMRWRESVN